MVCALIFLNSYSEVTYESSNAGVINPGRGVVVLLDTKASDHTPLTVS